MLLRLLRVTTWVAKFQSKLLNTVKNKNKNITGKSDAIITGEEIIQVKNKWIREVQREMKKAKLFENHKTQLHLFKMTTICGPLVER